MKKSDFSRVDLETCIAGCFVAILTALDRDAADRAIETMWALVKDKRTGDYERKFFTDLVESIEMAQTPPAWAVFESLETIH